MKQQVQGPIPEMAQERKMGWGERFRAWLEEEVLLRGMGSKAQLIKVETESQKKTDFSFANLVWCLTEVDESLWISMLNEFSKSALDHTYAILSGEQSKKKTIIHLMNNRAVKNKLEKDDSNIGNLLDRFMNSLLAARSNKSKIVNELLRSNYGKR